MSEDEWDAIAAYIYAKCNVNNFSLIVDCAYLDFADKKARENMVDSIKCISEKVVVYLCLSCSKTFSIYGLRSGELITICHDKAILDDIDAKSMKVARGAWSSSNHMVMNTIIDVLSNPKGRKELIDGINESKEIVEKRSNIFLKEAKEYRLKHYPYSKGFFVTLIIDNAYQVSEELMKYDIYLAPISNSHLRVALCSIPTNKIYGLAKKIREVVDYVKK